MTNITDTARATAATAEVTLGGCAYRLSPLTDADVGELDNWVRARTIRTARRSGRGLPEPEAQALLRQAFASAATQTWFGALGLDCSIDMLARLFWQLVKRHHPDISLEAVRQAIAANPDALADALDAFDLLHATGDAEKNATIDRGLSRFSRRGGHGLQNVDYRRENGTVPLAAPDKGAIYRALSARYGWTPQTIAQLSLDQQLMYLAGRAARTDPRTGRPVLTFPTERDYREWHERGS
jgi:hypothetical protein